MLYLLIYISFSFPVDLIQGESRTVPVFGFNGNTVRGPSWLNSDFTDSVGTMQPHILRYPGGLATYWDWSTGWFLDPPVIDLSLIHI